MYRSYQQTRLFLMSTGREDAVDQLAVLPLDRPPEQRHLLPRGLVLLQREHSLEMISVRSRHH